MLQRGSTAWHEALDAYVRARAERAFDWGPNDCCTAAADWVLLVTETDPMADLRGYASERQARALLQRLGGICAAVTARMGEPLPGTFARVGDVALVRHGEGRLSMGVCIGEYIAAPGLREQQLAPITDAEAAWRVG